jgi:N-acetylmuramoyl-L-alanine amidase
MLLSASQVRYLVVHCSATKPSMNWGRKEIEHSHVMRGFSMIGYHLVIRRDGSVETGRPLDMIGAHVEGHNDESVGVCLVGGIDDRGQPENNFTPQQMTSLVKVLEFWRLIFPTAEILGHRDFSKVAKACPCFDVRKWLKEQNG